MKRSNERGRLAVGQPVSYSGFPGTVVRLYIDGDREGGRMYEVRLQSGTVCVCGADIMPDVAVWQLADDPAEYGDDAAKFILTTPDGEQAWVAMQNVYRSWSERGVVRCLTAFPRSMDVGDVVKWADGRMERCASCGFEPIKIKIA